MTKMDLLRIREEALPTIETNAKNYANDMITVISQVLCDAVRKGEDSFTFRRVILTNNNIVFKLSASGIVIWESKVLTKTFYKFMFGFLVEPLHEMGFEANPDIYEEFYELTL